MKLVLTVVQAEDASRVLSQLASRGFGSTRIKTVGGFLRAPNATIFVGVEDEDVEAVLHTIGEACTVRRERIVHSAAGAAARLPWSHHLEVGGATVMVLNIVRFERV
jgi:uncharacterized protein YaaQ